MHTVKELTEKAMKIRASIKANQPIIDEIEKASKEHKSKMHRLDRIMVNLSEIQFYEEPNLESIRRAVIRGWGNAYIADENNKGGWYQMNDWDRMARACGLTEDDKIYAIRLMDGDVFDEYQTHKALNIYLKSIGRPYDDMYILE